MKQLLLIISILPIFSYGQSSLGIKLGATFSHINTSIKNAGSTYSSYTGPNIGAIYSYTFDKFQITAEPGYNQIGFTWKMQLSDNTGQPVNKYSTSKYIYKIIEAPITFGWLPVNDKFILGINAGLSPGVILSNKINIDNPSRSFSYNWSKFSMGVIGGIKAGVNLSDHLFININGRYGYELTSIINGNFMYWNTFLELGYKF